MGFDHRQYLQQLTQDLDKVKSKLADIPEDDTLVSLRTELEQQITEQELCIKVEAGRNKAQRTRLDMDQLKSKYGQDVADIIKRKRQSS